MRLEGKVAVIVGAGQSPGEGIGNGRATTLRFAQEGARILAVDRLIDSAEETALARRAGTLARARAPCGRRGSVVVDWRNGSMNTARTIRRRGSRFWKPPSTGISPRKPTRPPISLAPPLL
jgi:NAD(P)-dependent dehydrogenase (short-subunit alcohol dehydrogenase family)